MNLIFNIWRVSSQEVKNTDVWNLMCTAQYLWCMSENMSLLQQRSFKISSTVSVKWFWKSDTVHITPCNETLHMWTTFCIFYMFPQLWHQDKAVSFACNRSYKAPSRHIVDVVVLAQGKYHLLSLIDAVDLITKPHCPNHFIAASEHHISL